MSRRRTNAIFALCFISWTTAYGEGVPARIDAFGDPLPEGAIYRLGTTRLRVLPRTFPFGRLSFDSKGMHILAYDAASEIIRMWEIAGGREVRNFHAEYRSAFTISPDGTDLAVADSDKIRVYELATGKSRLAIEYIRERDDANAIAYSPDGKNILALCECNKNDRVTRWEAATGKKLGAWNLAEDRPIAFSPDTRLVASVANEESVIRLWDTASGKKVREWKPAAKMEDRSRCLSFSPDGRYLATAGRDAMIRIYETANGKEIRSWKVRTNGGDAHKFIFPPSTISRSRPTARRSPRWIAIWSAASGTRKRAENCVTSTKCPVPSSSPPMAKSSRREGPIPVSACGRRPPDAISAPSRTPDGSRAWCLRRTRASRSRIRIVEGRVSWMRKMAAPASRSLNCPAKCARFPPMAAACCCCAATATTLGRFASWTRLPAKSACASRTRTSGIFSVDGRPMAEP